MKSVLAALSAFVLTAVGFIAVPATANSIGHQESVFKISPEGTFHGLQHYLFGQGFIFPNSLLRPDYPYAEIGVVEISDSDSSLSTSRRLDYFDSPSSCEGYATDPKTTDSGLTATVVALDCAAEADVLDGLAIESKTETTFEGSFARVVMSLRLVNPGSKNIEVKFLTGDASEGWSLANSGTGPHGDWEIYESPSGASYGLRSSDSFTSAPESNYFAHQIDAPFAINDTFQTIVDVEFFFSPTDTSVDLTNIANGDFGAKIPTGSFVIPADFQSNAICDFSSFGAYDAPELINSVDDLHHLELINLASKVQCEDNQWSAHLLFSTDLDLTGIDWQPLDVSNGKLSIQGAGHSITGLSINKPKIEDVGFFGIVGDLTIYDIHMRVGTVVGGRDVGALVGDSNEDVYVYDSTILVDRVVGTGADLGGLGGYIDDDAKVGNSNIFIGTVNPDDSLTQNSDVGGLFGDVDGDDLDVFDSYVSVGSVLGRENVGGLAGFVEDDLDIERSAINIGQVKGYADVGGLVGAIRDDVNDILESSIRVGTVEMTGMSDGETTVGVIVGGSTDDDHLDVVASFVSGSVLAAAGSDGSGIELSALLGREEYMMDAEIDNSFLDLGVFSATEITAGIRPEYEAVAIGVTDDNLYLDDSTIYFETDAEIGAPFEVSAARIDAERISVDFSHKIYANSTNALSSGFTIEDEGENIFLESSALRYSPKIQSIAGSGAFNLNLLADHIVDTSTGSVTDTVFAIDSLESVNVQSEPGLIQKTATEIVQTELHPAYNGWTTSFDYLDFWKEDHGEKFFFHNCPGLAIPVSTVAVPDCDPHAGLPSSKTVQISSGGELDVNVFNEVRFPVSMSGLLPMGLVLDPNTGQLSGKLHPNAELESIELTFNHPTGERTMTLNFSTQPFSAPVPFDGPIITSVTSNAESIIVSGERLDMVEELSVDNQLLEIELQSESQVVASVAEMQAGQKTLTVKHQMGSLDVQFRVGSVTQVAADDFDTNFWTKQISDNEIKFYAKNIVGAGKVQFFHNGNEVAWVNAEDASDPKLRVISSGPMTGANYLVRTRELVAGKNVFEIYVDGERVLRRAQGN